MASRVDYGGLVSGDVAQLREEDDEEVAALVLKLRETGNLQPLVAMLRNGEVGPERARAALYVLGEADLDFLVQVALDSLITGYVEDPALAHQPKREIRPDDTEE